MNKVDEIIGKCNEIVELLWKNNENAYCILEGYVGILGKQMEEIVAFLSKSEEQENRKNVAIILQQIENLNIALQKKDDYMLADVLKYEIIETLYYYKGLMDLYGEG